MPTPASLSSRGWRDIRLGLASDRCLLQDMALGLDPSGASRQTVPLAGLADRPGHIDELAQAVCPGSSKLARRSSTTTSVRNATTVRYWTWR